MIAPRGLFPVPAKIISIDNCHPSHQCQNVRCTQTQQTTPTNLDQPSKTVEFSAIPVSEAFSKPKSLSICEK